MVQVAAEDTIADYVICRGFDPRISKFIDYEEGNDDKPGIPVAKPYGNRKTGVYKLAEIHAALLPLQSTNPSPTSVPWRVGQNPGVSVDTEGHPADLDEVVDELYTEEGKLINWMMADSASSSDYVEITYIDDDERSFDMKDYGVCIGKKIIYLPDESWAIQYPGSVIEDVVDGEVFCGFVDQSRAGVPGQRYYARSNGNKTCGEIMLPLVMLEGGAPTAAILAEDHPGCGTVFEVWIAPVWQPGSHEWDTSACDGATKYKAIDLREGVPLPAKYATGLFAPRVSLTYGIILEAIDIDCESPGECGFCTP